MKTENLGAKSYCSCGFEKPLVVAKGEHGIPFAVCRSCGRRYTVVKNETGHWVKGSQFTEDHPCPKCGKFSLCRGVDPDGFQPLLNCLSCKEVYNFEKEMDQKAFGIREIKIETMTEERLEEIRKMNETRLDIRMEG